MAVTENCVRDGVRLICHELNALPSGKDAQNDKEDCFDHGLNRKQASGNCVRSDAGRRRQLPD